jgi:hypothetical protein
MYNIGQRNADANLSQKVLIITVILLAISCLFTTVIAAMTILKRTFVKTRYYPIVSLVLATIGGGLAIAGVKKRSELKIGSFEVGHVETDEFIMMGSIMFAAGWSLTLICSIFNFRCVNNLINRRKLVSHV